MINQILESLFPNWTPKPKWDPIQNLDSIDLIAEHTSGNVELVIIASQPLDGSDEVQELIKAKFRTYMSIIKLPEFLLDHPSIKSASDIIVTLNCESMIHSRSKATIEKFGKELSMQGSIFQLVR